MRDQQGRSSITSKLVHKLYHGHIFCQVFHRDYIVSKGFDTTAVEHALWKLLDARGAEYPAGHNFGHLCFAKPALLDHDRTLDPSNSFNLGIGHTSKYARWADAQAGTVSCDCAASPASTRRCTAG